MRTTDTNAPSELMGDIATHNALERIDSFRKLTEPKSARQQGGGSVADDAYLIAEQAGPSRVFAVLFEGDIVLTRKWPDYANNPNGREVQLHPDRTMSLGTDYAFESAAGDTHRQPLDLDEAVAWLTHNTRRRNPGAAPQTQGGEQATPIDPALEQYNAGYRDGLAAAAAEVARLVPKPGAHLEHALSAIRHLTPPAN